MKQQIRVLTLLPLSLAVASAYAQTDDEYTTLDTSVVSAAGYAQDVREAPASVSVITSEELKTKPVIDLGTAVGDVPGVDIDMTKMGNSTVSMRGFDANYTLILQDGRRQNFSTAMMERGFNPTTGFIPPVNMIERIEVLRGPASTTWGSDAVGGVVNVITKKHVKELTGSVTIEGTFHEDREMYGDSAAASFFFGVPLI
ncbi:MAG: TonB-dependent receptor plug domain-containing protein, partial [Sutterellaceae bacterium]|nr:TonB-dependent receptor plug domain-containing protein [Sutterellaceae bacterium]